MIRIALEDPIGPDDERDVERIQRAALDDVGRGHEAGLPDLRDRDACDVYLFFASDGPLRVGFGALAHWTDPRWPGWYLRMSAVLPEYQGHGIARRLIRSRLRFAARNGATEVLTYTLPGNAESNNALIAAGFRVHRPTVLYRGTWPIYWRRSLG